MLDQTIRWFFMVIGFAGMTAVAIFGWVPPYHIVALVAFLSLMLTASLSLRVIYNEQKAAPATQLQAGE